MPSNKSVSISPSGAIVLGQDITCDGFVYQIPIRVQTHVHQDHMANFSTSKQQQKIYMSDATKRLLEAELNADLPYRQNIHAVELGEEVQLEHSVLSLFTGAHMLGGVQVRAALDSGEVVGYSSDFGSECKAIKVDSLVLDSTYGSPKSVRKYSQELAEEALVEKVREGLQVGSVHIKAYLGTIHRALNLLSYEFEMNPFIGSRMFIDNLQVFRDCGYGIKDVLDRKSNQGQQAINGENCVVFYSRGDKLPVDPEKGTSRITLSACFTQPNSPICEYSTASCSIAMSDHADFEETVKYVEESGAKYVLVDNFHGNNGQQLAEYLRRELSIESDASHSIPSPEWGT